MFQFTGLPISHMPFQHVGFPIRISRDLSLYATPPSFSQLITSFFGFYYLGILRVPLFSFLILYFFLLSQLTLYLLDSLTCSVVTFYLTIHFSLSYISLVEISGFEPLTSALQGQRSPNWAISPYIRPWLRPFHGGHDWTRTSDPCVISTVL